MHSHQFATSDGVTLSYQDTGGDGIPLVMLPGWGQTQQLFHHQLSLDRRVITVDHRGHGLSDKPVHGYRIARLARDIVELCEHLELEELDVLGHSMGASVLWSVYDLHGPWRIRRMISVDQPAAVTTTPSMSTLDKQQSGAIVDTDGVFALAENLAGPNGAQACEEFVATMFKGPAPDVWAEVVEAIHTLPAHAAVPLLKDHARIDWRDVLPTISIPTLLIGCANSHVSTASQRYIAEQIPQAQLHIADVDNHFPFLTDPDGFNTVLDKFLTA